MFSILSYEGDDMKNSDHLSKEKEEQLDKIHSPKKKTNKKKEEAINWHELMGSNNRGLYRGKGGALKRR
jgi:hypothetical protein